MVHIVLIMLLKIIYDIVPGVSQETSWTLTNISYMFGSYIMFHWVRGVPFEFNAGAYDNLNMWEQIDDGAQYTPAKKFLLSVPIVLFLLSTHYTHYDLTYFTINFLAVLSVVIPKLPYVRILPTYKPAFVRAAFVVQSLTSHDRATGCALASSLVCLKSRNCSCNWPLSSTSVLLSLYLSQQNYCYVHFGCSSLLLISYLFFYHLFTLCLFHCTLLALSFFGNTRLFFF